MVVFVGSSTFKLGAEVILNYPDDFDLRVLRDISIKHESIYRYLALNPESDNSIL